MDPKKMLIRPEKTAEADEKKAAEAAEEKELQEHYEHAESLLRAAEKDPEKVKAAGEEIGVDYSVIADHATAMRVGLKKYAGKPVSEEEESEYAEKRSPLKKVIEAKMHKDFQEKSPEERAKSVNLMEKMLRRFPRAIREKLLKEFKMVVSDAPSEASEENDKENA
ncbi:hypothetical protein F4009_16600 [Candidatus Poribacteria bacterium]|nr:hypothetical protein [Candidatus Poribacteria bacterium]MYH83856.1 hypothetical protein [Candidatus Poribacteria bacterium]MYK95591.1 hypothetical protein [Candidatus Poribacteria bacterium]